MAIEEGKTAPPFTLPDQTGRDRSLKNFRGRDVVVYFYPRDDTPGCTKEACGFRDLWQAYSDERISVLGISPDDELRHEAFIEKHQLPFTLLSDPRKKVIEKYGAWGEKTMYGKKAMGVIRSTVWIDAEGRVVRHWKRVANAADHPAKVLQVIREARR